MVRQMPECADRWIPGTRPGMTVVCAARASIRLAREDVDRAGAVVEARDAAAGGMRQADLGVPHLAGPGFAAQLAHHLDHLGCAGGADRMALGEQSARRVDRDLAVDLRRAAVEEGAGLAARAEAEGLVVDQLGDGEGVV